MNKPISRSKKCPEVGETQARRGCTNCRKEKAQVASHAGSCAGSRAAAPVQRNFLPAEKKVGVAINSQS